MKKPFISLARRGETLKLLLAISLCAAALTLYFLPGKSVAVFSDGSGTSPNNLFGLISNML